MFKALMKIRLASLANMFMRGTKKNGKGKASKGKIIAFSLLYIYVLVVFGMMFGGMFASIAIPFYTQGVGWLYFALYSILSLALMVFGSTAIAKTQIFDAKDNDLLLSMPIPPSYILMSRMSLLVIINFIYQLTVFIPAVVVWAVVIGFSVVGFISFILLTIGLLLFSTSLAILLGWLIALVSRKSGRKTLITMIFSLGFLAVYMYFCMSAQNLIGLIATSGESLASAMKAFPPMYWLGNAISGGNILHLILSLAILVIPFVVAMLILSKTFNTIVSQSQSVARIKEKRVSFDICSPERALLRRDSARLFSSATYLLNSGVGVIMAIVAAVMLIIKRDTFSLLLTSDMPIGKSMLATMLIFGTAFIIGMIPMTAASISIEGKTLWILKSLPIKTSKILWSKLKLNIIACLPAGLAMWLAINICLYVNIAFAFYSLIIILSYIFLTAGIGLMENIRHPILDWSDEAMAVKSGLSVLFTMLINMVLAFAPILTVVILSMIDLWVTLAVWFAVLIILNVILYSWIMTRGAKRFMEL